MVCKHCTLEVTCGHEAEHPELCCDCFDLKHGMPLEALNAARVAKGRPPIERPWRR